MSDQVFYRKYRPQSFSQIIGQDVAKRILINSILSGNYSHAYLFTGPRGTGKTTTARTFAKSLNCLSFKDNNDVCNKCDNCKIFNSGQAIDVVEMDAASNRGIDDVRSLRENILFMPSVFKKKIYIIDEAHMLSREAFNALLKTLEEPPEHVVFILATTESNKIPITIMSRLVRIDFELASELALENKLKSILGKEQIEYDSESIKHIINYARGSFRDAESILTKITQDSKILKKEIVQDLLGTVDEQLVIDFANELESRSVKQETLKKLFGIKNKKPFFEALLEKAFLKQLDKEIVNAILKVIFNIDKLDNKELVINLYLSKFQENPAKTFVKEQNVEKGENNKVNLELSENISSKLVDRPNKTVNNISIENGFSKYKISNAAISDDRARSIIDASDLYFDNNTGVLYIFTNFKFNLNYLVKEEINKKILSEFTNTDKNILSIEILLEAEKKKFGIPDEVINQEDVETVDNKSLDNMKTSNKYEKIDIKQNDSNVIEVINTKSKITENSNQIDDNSDIIEGIL